MGTEPIPRSGPGRTESRGGSVRPALVATAARRAPQPEPAVASMRQTSAEAPPLQTSVVRDKRRGVTTAALCAFDTLVRLTLVGAAEPCAEAAQAAGSMCRSYERLFSRTIADSDVSRLQQAARETTASAAGSRRGASAGTPVRIAPETAALIRCALTYCARSQGAFDITIGSVTPLWDFKRQAAPTCKEAARAAQHVDWRCVKVWRGKDRPSTDSEQDGTWFARIDPPACALDLGGIAKGWIADRLCELLENCGIRSFIVDLGGNVAVRGTSPEGKPWTVGIRDPARTGACLATFPLKNASAVTSGVYERGFVQHGRLLHHILDPRTGFPVDTDVASVTVVARRSLDAEGFSTTLLALGSQRGAKLARSLTEIDRAIFVTTAGEVFTIPAG